MSKENLPKVKEEVQKILDNHLEENQRFSIQDLDEESTFLLIDILTENDDLERKNLRAQIEGKIKDNKINLHSTYEKISLIKCKLDFQKNEIKDLGDLKNIIHTENELDNKLEDI